MVVITGQPYASIAILIASAKANASAVLPLLNAAEIAIAIVVSWSPPPAWPHLLLDLCTGVSWLMDLIFQSTESIPSPCTCV